MYRKDAQSHMEFGQWIGKIGQIRIVDMSSMLWAHINVDDFQFDWDNSPATNDGKDNVSLAAMVNVGTTMENHLELYVLRCFKIQTSYKWPSIPELCQQFCNSDGCFFNGFTEGWGELKTLIDGAIGSKNKSYKPLTSVKMIFGSDVAVDFGAGMIIVGSPGSRIGYLIVTAVLEGFRLIGSTRVVLHQIQRRAIFLAVHQTQKLVESWVFETTTGHGGLVLLTYFRAGQSLAQGMGN